MNIIHIATEVGPFSKVGGLADVLKSLPPALAQNNLRVLVFSPFYREVKSRFPDPEVILPEIEAKIGDSVKKARILRISPDKNPAEFYFIDNPGYFDRDGIYGTPRGNHTDNAQRYLFFCRAALEAMRKLAVRPAVVHCHDWQTTPACFIINKIRELDPVFADTKTIVSVHNLSYQGMFLRALADIDDIFKEPEFELHGKINFLKAGLVSADALMTVSPNYAKEILTKEFGCGLEGVLMERSRDLTGILNGADYQEWDPACDAFIDKQYDLKTISIKKDIKLSLLDALSIKKDRELPVVGFVSRLVYQKGIDIFLENFNELAKKNIRFVILGNGEKSQENKALATAKKYPGRLSVKLAFDNPLAHKIMAGADFLMIPSRHEPCGLTQLYAMKYGTIPIVNKTGGLSDTVIDDKTGIVFSPLTAQTIANAVERAIKLYNDKTDFTGMRKKIMSLDWSWKKSAKAYKALYEKLLG
ncbi:glycogen synthase [Elusimicrobiota bacterium]